MRVMAAGQKRGVRQHANLLDDVPYLPGFLVEGFPFFAERCPLSFSLALSRGVEHGACLSKGTCANVPAHDAAPYALLFVVVAPAFSLFPSHSCSRCATPGYDPRFS